MINMATDKIELTIEEDLDGWETTITVERTVNADIPRHHRVQDLCQMVVDATLPGNINVEFENGN